MRTKRNKGFTLTEVAIVLGIFSVIMTGIWSLANDAREKARQELFAEQLMQIVQSIRTYYQGQEGIGIVGGFEEMQSIITNRVLNLVPANTIVTQGGGLIVVHPWNNVLEVASGDGISGTLDPNVFTIRLRGFNPGTCARVLMRSTDAGSPSGLLKARVFGNPMVTFGDTSVAPSFSLPTTLTAALNSCNRGNDNTIHLVYRLRAPMN